MQIFMFILFIIIIICLLLIWYASTYNRYQTLLIKITEVETNIDNVLRKRYDLLKKARDLIKKEKKIDNPLDTVTKIKSKKLDNFELDRELINGLNEYQLLIEEYDDLKKKEAFVKINIGLNESESEIEAFRKYYNDIITEYNHLANKFPTNLVSIFSGYEKKQYFDQKEDNIVKL